MKRCVLALVAVVLVGTVCSAVAQPAGTEKIGQVSFPVPCKPAVQKPFERAVALLHSFWYLESLKAFTAVTDADPDCAIGYWGAALSLWYQIWSPPSPANLKRSAELMAKAKAASVKTPRDRDLIAAADAFFSNSDTQDHRTRVVAYERAMEQVAGRYPNDREVQLFYALALQAAADPKDKTYSKQRKSAEIAEKVFTAEPDHPGAAHIIIHAYDYPELAKRGLPAAGRYAQFAPSVPHALHMPSHIYVLLGMWPEVIQGNLVAAAAEKQRGNPDDHMHAIDYLVYGYLQQGQDADAKRILDEARGIMSELAAKKYDSGRPTAHFAISAVEARWAMERGQWTEAAAIEPRPNRFAHTEAMIYFARGIGAARAGQAAQARAAVEKLDALRDALTQQKNTYWAEQVEIQRRAVAAWTLRAEGKPDDALTIMRAAADLEDSTEKHNITPGPIVAARELLADMLLELGQAAPAAKEYEASLQRAPNRFKAVHGVAKASELAGDRERAKAYYTKLVALAKDDGRPEVKEARAFLAR